MTAVAAAILSFGGQRFYGEPLAVLASIPLIFWFWSTYVPLNRYGEQALDNLVTIEGRITTEAQATVDHFQSFRSNRPGAPRARHAIYVSMILLHLAFVWSLWATIGKLSAGDHLVRDPAPVATPATTPAR
jgi:hypothetical protein